MALDKALKALNLAVSELGDAINTDHEDHRLKLEVLLTEAEWVEGRVSTYLKEIRRREEKVA